MTRSTFRALFYANGSKEKNGIVPIMGRVTINGTVAQFISIVLTHAKNIAYVNGALRYHSGTDISDGWMKEFLY